MPEPVASDHSPREIIGYVVMGLIGVARAFVEWRKATSKPITLFGDEGRNKKSPSGEVSDSGAAERRFAFIEYRLDQIDTHNQNQHEWQLSAHKDNQATNERLETQGSQLVKEVGELRTLMMQFLSKHERRS